MFDYNFSKQKKRKVDNVTKENDKTFIQDGLSSDEIRKTIRNIREYIEKNGNTTIEDRIEKLKVDYSFFLDRYPMLFDMCVRPSFDFNNLNYFLQKREEIINDRSSSEDVSAQIGKEWFDKYVDVSKLDKKN